MRRAPPGRAREHARPHRFSLAGFLIGPEIPLPELLRSHPQIPKSTDSWPYTILDRRRSLEIFQVNVLTLEMRKESLFAKVASLEVFLLPVREPLNRSSLVLF